MITKHDREEFLYSLSEISKFQMKELCKNPIDGVLNGMSLSKDEKKNIKNNYNIKSNIVGDNEMLMVTFEQNLSNIK
ncbi:TPA: hypothetical protein ACXDAZ_002593 [Clostridium botulinum]